MFDLSKTKVIDLTHPLYHGMPAWPTHSGFSVRDFKIMEIDGYRVRRINMNTHHGTHVDAEAHVMKNGKTISEYDLDHFMGPGLVIDLSYKKEGEEITDEDLKKFGSIIKKKDIVLLHSGWSKYRGFNQRYLYLWPYLDKKAAEYLRSKEIKMIGTDGLSIGGWSQQTPMQGPLTSSAGEVHRILLSDGILIVEEMNNLDEVLDGKNYSRAFVMVLPLSLDKLDGAPVRAIALKESDLHKREIP